MRTCQSKAPHFFSVEELLEMATIQQRHPDIQTKAGVVGGTTDDNRESHWEPDPATGVKCPPPPGKTTPLIELPDTHAAIWYVKSRGFEPRKLWEQFRASWCYEEYPAGQNGIHYRQLPGGWKDTPQGRIIFHSMHKGTPMTWQGRYLEYVSEDGLNKYALHPYRNEWSHLATRAGVHQPWIPVAPFDETDANGNLKMAGLSKYRTAKYSYRAMMGWDAALAAPDKDGLKWCVLCEGPLDAARVGPGGVALIGKSISAENAAKVAEGG